MRKNCQLGESKQLIMSRNVAKKRVTSKTIVSIRYSKPLFFKTTISSLTTFDRPVAHAGPLHLFLHLRTTPSCMKCFSISKAVVSLATRFIVTEALQKITLTKTSLYN